MVANLLLRGMLAGIVASILCFAFLSVVGEPRVDRAIALEEAAANAAPAHRDDAMAPHEHDAAAPVHHHDEEDAPVSRATQAGIGLFTAVFFFGAALGGLFSLAFAFVQGRMSRARPRATAAAIAVVGWAAVSLVPALKYPANPPAVGNPGTIGLRTAVFFGMIGLSLVAVLAAAALRSRLLARLGAWDATIVSGVAYAVLMAIAWLALPALNEVPAGYPADLLWQFRLVSFGAQFLLWTTIGLVFGWLVERERAAARLLSARG